MNKVILLVLLMPVSAFGQIMENFESGSLSGWIQSPGLHWNSDNNFSLSGAFSLHHSYDNPNSGTDRIGLSVENLHPDEGVTRWSFKVRYGYDPSASNNWVVFLMCVSDPVSYNEALIPDGFALGVNQTGYDDTLRLWKVKSGLFSAVISSHINWQTMIGVNETATIVAERSASGAWKMEVSGISGGLTDSSSGIDPEFFSPGWFIICYKYTSTRDRLLWIDDVTIDGVFYEDRKSPMVIKCDAGGKNSLSVTFSEKPSEESLLPANFSTSVGTNQALKVIRSGNNSVSITFTEQFKNKSPDSLIIHSLCDMSGNCGNNLRVEFISSWPDPGDIVITEIMADPTPVVSLPGKEFIELFNRTRYEFNLKNWILIADNQNYLFPDKLILPGAYVILCSAADTVLFSEYGSVMGFKSFPVLTDNGRILAVRDSSGSLIHGIKYSSDWYLDELKTSGGWSLEMIDTDFPFFTDGNWQASISLNGGSPGQANSVSRENPDNLFTGLENVFPEAPFLIRLKLSETVFSLDEKIKSIRIDENDIDNISPSDLLLKEYLVVPHDSLKKGKIYTLRVSEEIKDFAGNKMQNHGFRFGIPEAAVKGDILFNELLFNPLPGDPDFLEFYNSSDKIIDVSKLLLVSVNDETKDTSGIYYLSSEGRCLVPGDYFVITTDRKKILKRFNSSVAGRIFQIPSLPSMPDDKGHLILFSRDLKLIDEVYYNENIHYSLLQSFEGISLEKIRPNSSSGNKSYWFSASETSGWGTPGQQNSVSEDQQLSVDKVVLSSTRITPDNDGNDDLLIIDLKLTGIGNIVSVWVFDETGSIVKKLTDNLLAGTDASIVWNGTANDEKLVETGIYIILISVFNDSGKVQKWKKICTVIRK